MFYPFQRKKLSAAFVVSEMFWKSYVITFSLGTRVSNPPSIRSVAFCRPLAAVLATTLRHEFSSRATIVFVSTLFRQRLKVALQEFMPAVPANPSTNTLYLSLCICRVCPIYSAFGSSSKFLQKILCIVSLYLLSISIILCLFSLCET